MSDPYSMLRDQFDDTITELGEAGDRVAALEAQLAEARAVLREVTWLGADQVPGICFHPADAFRWVFCVSCKTWTRADQPNDPTKLHTPDCRLAKALEGT